MNSSAGNPSSLGARARQRHALLPKLLPLLVICAALALSAAWAVSPRDALPPSAAAAAPTLTPPDGGAGWNAAHGLPEFPIGVWGSFNHTQANRDLDATAGINTYVWAADSLFMPEIRSDGRFKVIQDEGLPTNVGSETVGRLLGDEWDMTGESCPDDLNTVKNRLPADGLLRVMNYGKGLALPPGDDPGVNGNWWSGTAEQNCLANGVDLASVDLYWFTDPWQGDFCCGYRYGDNITNLRNADATDGQRHPNWSFVEVGEPWGPNDPDPKRSILPAEIRSAVWHSVIAGARGILYFQHSFGGACRGDSHVIRSNCEGTRPIVTTIDAQLKRLAPVLNSSTVTSDHSVTGNVRRMVKWDGSHFYVFAGATTGATTMNFSMPCIGSGATAVNLGETAGGGSIPLNANGSFSDSFADRNAVHIYRIDGGSDCGLPPGAGGGGPGTSEGGQRTAGRARIGRLPRRVSLGSRRLVIPVRCTAACTVRSRLTTRVESRRILLASARRRFSAGRHRVVLRISRRERRRVAGGRSMRLRTVIVQRGARVQLIQRLEARHR